MTSPGRLYRVAVVDVPVLPIRVNAEGLAGGISVRELVAGGLGEDEQVLCVTSLKP